MTLQRVAATPITGVAKIDNTQNILSWTLPDDGELHRVALFYTGHVTSAETGGAVTFGSMSSAGGGVLLPDGSPMWVTVTGGGSAPGGFSSGMSAELVVGPGCEVFLYQSSALTAGSSVLWAEIWAA